MTTSKNYFMPRKTVVIALSIFILLSLLFGFLLRGLGETAPITSVASSGVAVVELFTSEGCSSCPPADHLLDDLKKQNNTQVFLLAFHVDYWNYLGWKDRFSDAQYSSRQQDYSHVLNTDVYTPQMIVNGSKVFVGSDRSKANGAIATALGEPSPVQIKFQVEYNETKKTVDVKYQLTGDMNDQVLNIALSENEATNNISRGENSGRTLHHVNIVRNFKTIPLSSVSGESTIDFPSDLTVNNASVILYSQNVKTKQVTGAAAATLGRF